MPILLAQQRDAMSVNTKFIVWDWNGTLFDDVAACLHCANLILAHTGRPAIDENFYREAYDIPIDRFYLNLGFNEDELRINKSKMQNIFHDHYEDHAIKSGLRDGAKEILARAKQTGVCNYVLSNHLRPSIEQNLDRLNIAAFIDSVMAFETRETQFYQPKGVRFATHMREVGLVPTLGMIIGDTPEEVHIGKELGLTTVALTGGNASEARLIAARPDHVIHSLKEMPALLLAKGFVP